MVVKFGPQADPDAGLALDNVFWNMRVFQLHSPRGLDFIAGKAVLAVTSTMLLILYELRMSQIHLGKIKAVRKTCGKTGCCLEIQS